MSSSWAATVLTLFPDTFPGPLGASLPGKALEKNLWSLEVRDIRDHGLGKHRTVDDTPAGGGPGMVMRADVAAAAIDAVERGERPLIYLSPRGLPLTQARVRTWRKVPARCCCAGGSKASTSACWRRARLRNSAWVISCWRGARSPPWP